MGASINDDGTAAAPVTLHWNGTSWTTIPSPDPATGAQPSAALGDVTAVSASSAWAVGSYTTGGDGTGDPPHADLLLHWDGHSWTQTATPHPGTDNELHHVAAGPAGTFWTVGHSDDRQTALEFGTVPNVTGQPRATAIDAMNSAGLRSTITNDPIGGPNCSKATNGDVISTNPTAGVLTASPVSLLVCALPSVETVPNLVGDSGALARFALQIKGLTVGTVTLTSNCARSKGTVLSQDPAAGQTVPLGSAVNLTESNGLQGNGQPCP